MEIKIIDNHDEALLYWNRSKDKPLTLYHFDAHFDYAPFAQKELMNIGNFIYAAVSEKRIDRFIWIIPTPSFDNKLILKKIINSVNKFSELKMCTFGAYKGCLTVNGHKVVFFIGTLCHLKYLTFFDDQYIIDIDIDFFMNPLIQIISYSQVFKHSMWISPYHFVSMLSELPSPDVVTIARSTNGGFTPYHYGFLAEMIRDKLLENEKPIYSNIIHAVEFLENDQPESALIICKPYMHDEELLDYVSYILLEIAIQMEDQQLYIENIKKISSSYTLRYLLNLQQILSMNQNKQAYHILKKWYMLDEHNPILSIFLVQLHIQKRKKCFKTSLMLPENAEGIYYRGCIKYLNKEYKAAIKDLETSLNILKLEYHEWEGVTTAFPHVQMTTPVKLSIYQILAESYYQLDDYKKSYLYYSLILRLGGSPFRLHHFKRVSVNLNKKSFHKKTIQRYKSMLLYKIKEEYIHKRTYRYIQKYWEIVYEKYRECYFC